MKIYTYSDMIHPIFFSDEIIELVDGGIAVFENHEEHRIWLNQK